MLFRGPQVEDDRGRHDGNGRDLGAITDAVLFQPGHHPVGRRQPEGAAAGQQDAVDFGGPPLQVERRQLARARG